MMNARSPCRGSDEPADVPFRSFSIPIALAPVGGAVFWQAAGTIVLAPIMTSLPMVPTPARCVAQDVRLDRRDATSPVTMMT